MQKIAIIGGGAAGMMAAATLAEKGGVEIFLLEKNEELGKKVKISGGGRCNVTTGITDVGEVLKKYPRGAKFLRAAMYDFPPKAVFDWFEAQGVALKVEKDLRVFPQSNRGEDVVTVFERIFAEKDVKVMFGVDVSAVERRGERFVVNGLEVDKVVLTMGGQAYRHTGSEGDGYGIAESLGHRITDLGPSLNAFMVRDEWVKRLAGVSFADVRLRMNDAEFRGPMLMTHRGVTGPAVFALSSLTAFSKFSASAPADLRLDFWPDESYESLGKRVAALVASGGRKTFVTACGALGPKSLLKELLGETGERFAAEVGKKDVNKLVELLKNCAVAVVGRLPGEEFVTAGGVDTAEVDPATMESRICPGLFFAGEILNVDGFTGGYNLQAAWAMGRKLGS
ncbi:aminoacetone oxidase family FAD-binding enzyme [Candidatus Gracilibacteria bacterium]|nr:aminoacetone oxidase family FAD-binding enzyme [Candidatus Gracilibacteria bacterium]